MWQNVVLLISTHRNVTAAEKNVNKYLRFLVHDKMTNQHSMLREPGDASEDV